MSLELELGKFWAAIGGLVLFGIAYNKFIQWADSQGYLEGYTALAVAAGVPVTLAVFGYTTGLWSVVVMLLVFFAASGGPMIFGNVVKHLKDRKRLMDRIAGVDDD